MKMCSDRIREGALKLKDERQKFGAETGYDELKETGGSLLVDFHVHPLPSGLIS